MVATNFLQHVMTRPCYSGVGEATARTLSPPAPTRRSGASQQRQPRLRIKSRNEVNFSFHVLCVWLERTIQCRLRMKEKGTVDSKESSVPA